MDEKINKTSDYYKAYEKRYQQVYQKNMMWSTNKRTPEVYEIIKKLKLNNSDKILDLGCGEGRDAIYLLNKKLNVIAVDYSATVINKCNEITKYKYVNNFKQFDLLKNKMNTKFDFIYSIAVLHMFVLERHRNLFFKFIYEHLNNNGKALICVLGDGITEYSSNISDAFKNIERTVLNNNSKINVATTSCKIVNWNTLLNELSQSNLVVNKKWISKRIPEFSKCMCVLISKK